MLNWIKLGIVGVLLGALATYHYTALEAARKEVRTEYSQKLLNEQNKSLEKQGEIVLEALKIEQEKNEELKRINAYAASLLSSLQNRPSRTDNPPAPSVESSCTGRELYKEDGEFLVREASRADTILAERNYWFEQYENARIKLKELLDAKSRTE
jgi:hypothetical protein